MTFQCHGVGHRDEHPLLLDQATIAEAAPHAHHMFSMAVNVAAGADLWHSVGRPRNGSRTAEWRSFAGAAAIFVLAFSGLAYSLFPYIVIERMTIRQAASDPSALKVILAGALVVLPFIIGYTVFSYRVFRGKARALTYA